MKSSLEKLEYDRKYRLSHKKERYLYDMSRNGTKKRKEEHKKYRKTHKESINKYHRSYRAKARREAISIAGGKCSNCGFADWRALQLDHINGGGNKERQKIMKHSPTEYYKKILTSIKENCREYQVLCANCNQIKRYKGIDI